MRGSAWKWYRSSVRYFQGLAGLLAAAALAAAQSGAQTGVQEHTHFSQVMQAERVYRVFYPAGYAGGAKRYPVVYWLHGFESQSVRDAYSHAIENYVAAHDLLVVDAGPAETTGSFPMYITELVERVDQTLRTIPNRDHRGITGYALGGYMALWTAAKYPDMVGSASDFLGLTEASIGPKGFDVDCDLATLYGNLDGVRTRLVAQADGPASSYNRELASIWTFAAPHFEMDLFHPSAGPLDVARTLDFHMQAFAQPLAKPAVFSHANVYRTSPSGAGTRPPIGASQALQRSSASRPRASARRYERGCPPARRCRT